MANAELPTQSGWPELLALLRHNAGMSRSLAARRLRVDRMTVWRWEHGRSMPTPDNMEHIREVYKPELDAWLPLVLQWQLAWQSQVAVAVAKRVALRRARRPSATVT